MPKKRKKVFAKQLRLEPIVEASEPHEIVRCAACDEAKKLVFKRSGDDLLYYCCESCGFESEPMGLAPHYIK